MSSKTSNSPSIFSFFIFIIGIIILAPIVLPIIIRTVIFLVKIGIYIGLPALAIFLIILFFHFITSDESEDVKQSDSKNQSNNTGSKNSGNSSNSNNSKESENSIYENYSPEIVEHFSTLGISPTASPLEIKRAYKVKIKEYHPDTVTRAGEKIKILAEEESKKINIAYSVLKNNGYV